LKNKYFYLICVSSFLLLLDQGSKYWIRANIPLGRSIEVLPNLFRLGHVENAGAAWGILSSSPYRIPFFIVATIVAFIVIGIYFSKLPKDQTLLAIAMSSILGGAIGNFIDRLLYQSVTDFLDFYFGYQPIKGWLISTFRSNRWPSFNIADVAIVIGLGIVMYDMLFLEPKRIKAAEGAENAKKALLDDAEGSVEESVNAAAEGGSGR